VDRSTPPVFQTARQLTLALKVLIWGAFVVLVLCLAALVFNFMPYALAPFYVAGILKAPPPIASRDAIEGKLSDDDVRKRIARLRAVAAPPQAIAKLARNLTIVGIKFDDLRDVEAETSGKTGKAHPFAQPYPVSLDLSQATDSAIVALSDPSIAWSITPPDGPARPLFGLESRLLPEMADVPPGVLAGFRVGPTSRRGVAKPVPPFDAAPADQRRLCRSITDWASYFSVPLDRVSYLMVEDPTTLSFAGGTWTSDGTTVLSMDALWLQDACRQSYRSGWR
jgi:hypothetical protein